jgi:hypothetical protein
VFESDAKKAVDMLYSHSGGKISEALEMALGRGEIDDGKGEVSSTDKVEDVLDESKIVGMPVKREKEELSEKKGHVFHCFNCC